MTRAILLVAASVWTVQAAAAQQITLNVSGIPGAATRLVAVLDGGALTSPVRVVKDVAAGTVSSSIVVAVAAGGPYRARVAAFTAGLSLPPLLRTGLASGINVPATPSASVLLADFVVTALTPASALTGAAIALTVDVTDPGQFCDGAYGFFWMSPAPFTQNMLAPLSAGPIASVSVAGKWRLTTTVNAPTTAGTLYYQAGINHAAFSTSTEVPMLFWPNPPSAASLPRVTISAGVALTLTVTNIPASATRVVVVADRAGMAGVWRSVRDVVAGTSTTSMSIGLPEGGPYRLRGIAFTAGPSLPVVLRSGKVMQVSVAAGSSTSLALANVTLSVSPATPVAAPPGATITLAVNVVDPGDFLETAYGHIWCSQIPFGPNLAAPDCASGYAQATAAETYTFAPAVTLPSSPGTLYYQVSFNAVEFNTVVETPIVVTPALPGTLSQIGIGGTNPRPTASIPIAHFVSSNGATPALVTFSAAMDNQSAQPFGVTVTSDGGWLSATPATGTTPATVTLLANAGGRGSGIYSATVTLTAAGNAVQIPADLTVSGARIRLDLRGIGRSDIVLYNPQTGDGFTGLSDGMGGFSYTYQAYLRGFTHLRSGDFNGDGKADMTVYNKNNGFGYIALSTGAPLLPYGSLFWSPGYDGVEMGEFNGDGRTDVFLHMTDGTTYTGLSNGDGTFRYTYRLVSPNYTHRFVADFTGDGLADVFLYRRTDGLAHLGVGDGSGGFNFTGVQIDSTFDQIQTGDVNGDGKADILFYFGGNGVAKLGLATGAGFAFQTFSWTPGFTITRLLDYNGDGKADLVLYNGTTANGYLGISNGTGGFSFSGLYFGPGMDRIQVQDLNGDGKADVILYKSYDGAVYTGLSMSNPSNPFLYKANLWGPGKLAAE